ncbi:hypothetical protein KI387_023046, partial [Taxus chinensis]
MGMDEDHNDNEPILQRGTDNFTTADSGIPAQDTQLETPLNRDDYVAKHGDTSNRLNDRRVELVSSILTKLQRSFSRYHIHDAVACKTQVANDAVVHKTEVASVIEKSRNVRVFFGIFEPEEGCDIDDAVAHLTKVVTLFEESSDINVAIIKCVHNSWAAVFIVWKGEGSQNPENSALNLPQAAAFTKGLKCAVRAVDSGWFQPSSQQTSQGIPFAQLSLGDIVSIRRIYCSWKKQDALSYSCLAILRSYFNSVKGLISCSFYDSLDGKQIVGLGVWDGIESASALLKHPDKSPGLTYWKDMAEKKLEYHDNENVIPQQQSGRCHPSTKRHVRFWINKAIASVLFTSSFVPEHFSLLSVFADRSGPQQTHPVFLKTCLVNTNLSLTSCYKTEPSRGFLKPSYFFPDALQPLATCLECLYNSALGIASLYREQTVVFIVWKGEGSQNPENSTLNLPQAVAFTKGL